MAPAQSRPKAVGRRSSGLPEPRDEDRQQRQHVDHHAHVEGLGAVEDGLVRSHVGQGVGPRRRRWSPQVRHGAVEGRRRPGPSRPRPMRAKALEPGVHRAGGQRAQRLADVRPGLGALRRRAAGSGRNTARSAERRLALRRRPGARGAGDLGGEAGASAELDGVLEPVVEEEPLEEVGDRALEAACAACASMACAALACFWISSMCGDDLPEREVAVLAVCCRLHEPEHVGVVDDEDGLGVGHLRAGRARRAATRPGPTVAVLVERKLCWLRIMSSELRATESIGLTRPPSSTGRRPKPSTSKPRTWPGARSMASAADQRQAAGEPGRVLRDLRRHVRPPAPLASRAASRFLDDLAQR